MANKRHTLVKLLSLFPGPMGLIVILGWYLKVPELIQINPDFAPMQYNTALGFILCSLSLFFILEKKEKWAGRLSLAVTLLGSLNLLQYIFDIDLGIDKLFINDPFIVSETSHPGRMAPNTALCFFLTGISTLILSISSEKKLLYQKIIISLISIVLCLAFIAFIGYLTGITAGYGWGNLTRMAMHTSFGFLSLAAALLLYNLNGARDIEIKKELYQAWAIPFGLAFILLTATALDGEEQFILKKQLVVDSKDISLQFTGYQLQIENALIRKHQRLQLNESKYRNDSKNYLSDYTPLLAIGKHHQINDSIWIETKESHHLEIDIDSLIRNFSNQDIWSYLKTDEHEYVIFSYHSQNVRSLAILSLNQLKDTLLKLTEQKELHTKVDVHELLPNLNTAPPVTDHVQFTAFGLAWDMHSTPTPEYRFKKNSSFNYTILILTTIIVLALHVFLILSFNSYKSLQHNQLLSRQLIHTLDAMLDGVIVIDQFGTIENVNQATLKLFGYTQEELLGKNVKILMPEPYQGEHDQYLSNYRRDGIERIIGQQRTLKALKKSGEVFPITLLVTPNKEDEKKLFTGVVHDLSDLQTSQRHKAEIENLLNIAIETSPSAWAFIDMKGKIETLNNTFCKWLSYEQGDILGEPLINLLKDPSDKDSFENIQKIENLIHDKSRAVTLEAKFLKKNGKYRWGLLSASHVRDDEDQPVKIVAQIIDIHPKKQLELDLEERNKALEKSNADLDQFAYTASHDLKSPLNAIRNIANWIVEDCYELLPEDSKEHLDLLKARTERLTRLLNDLLEYSRAGRTPYPTSPINLRTMVDDITTLLNVPERFSIQASDIELIIPSTPFELLLRNLISNAIKHHDKPSGLIEILAEKKKKEYIIKVRDDGPGIPKDLHEKALQMFQTLRPRDEVEGSGMGLAICRKTVEAYQGTLNIESDGEHGTEIVINWPINPE